MGQRAVATAWKTCTPELITCWGRGPMDTWPAPTTLHPAEPGAAAVRRLGAVAHVLNSILAWTLLKGSGPLV